MRGLTMVSVVLVHVLVRSFGLNPLVSGLAIVRTTFTLPLFFFVSGFFAWRPARDFDRRRIQNGVTTRLKALLFGTIVFDTLWRLTVGKSPFAWLSGNFDEYWYTFSLLQIYIFYILTTLCAKLTRCQTVSWALLIGGAVAGLLATPFIYPPDWQYFWLADPKTLKFMQFFVFGALVRDNMDTFLRFLSRPWTLTVLIVAYVAGLALMVYGETELADAWRFLPDIVNELTDYAGVMLVMYIFHANRGFFDRETRFVRAWRFIGKRTLDIYFLHYFFIPSMRWVGPYLKTGNTFVLQLAAGLVVALFIIAICLGVSRLLRRAPAIRALLGAKS